MKRLALLFGFVLFLSCNADDSPDYNLREQLLADIEAIRAHLDANSLTAELDSLTGVFYNITRPGSVQVPERGDVVTLDYRLYNFQGQLLDTNLEQEARDANIYVEGRQYGPFQVTVGVGQVIAGFDRALTLLREDGEGIFYIPSVLAYQNVGNGNIAPNESIIFEIALNAID